MNRQEVFETVAKHLLSQNKKSIQAGSITCRYRGDGELKCAIGILIKDEFYSPKLEYLGIPASPVLRAVSASCAFITGCGSEEGTTNIELLIALQNTHDFCHVGDWRNDLIAVGHRFELNTDFIK